MQSQVKIAMNHPECGIKTEFMNIIFIIFEMKLFFFVNYYKKSIKVLMVI